MKTISQRIFFFVMATLFAASTVCCIVDDKWLDHSVLNYAHKHDCHATNCPICGAQYQAQFDTQHLQKIIAVASDELCTVLWLAYANTVEQQETFRTELALDTAPDLDDPHQPSMIPLRI